MVRCEKSIGMKVIDNSMGYPEKNAECPALFISRRDASEETAGIIHKKKNQMQGSICRETIPAKEDCVVSGKSTCGRREVGFDADIQCCEAVNERKERIVALLRQAYDELEKLAKERLRMKLSEGRTIGVSRELKDLIRVLSEESC